MCKNMEDMRNEAAKEAALDSARETAERLIKKVKCHLKKLQSVFHYYRLTN